MLVMPNNVDSYEALDTDATGQYETPVTISKHNPFGWMHRSACSQEKYEDLSWCGERAAPRPLEKRVCWEECPVRRDCLTWSITQAEKHCVYGGYNFGQRRLIWRKWKDEGVLPDVPRTRVDPAEMFRLMAESTISVYGDLPGTIDTSDPTTIYEYGEPSLKDLLAIESEES